MRFHASRRLNHYKTPLLSPDSYLMFFLHLPRFPQFRARIILFAIADCTPFPPQDRPATDALCYGGRFTIQPFH